MIRAAKPDDVAALSALSIEVWLSTYVKHGISPAFAAFVLAEFDQARMAALLADPMHTILVSERSEGLDGYIRVQTGTAAPLPDCGETEIATLYVQPRHQRGGAGSALLNAAMGQFGGPLWLKVNEENDRAKRFYTRHGFEAMGQVDFKIGDAAYPNDVMVWRSGG